MKNTSGYTPLRLRLPCGSRTVQGSTCWTRPTTSVFQYARMTQTRLGAHSYHFAGALKICGGTEGCTSSARLGRLRVEGGGEVRKAHAHCVAPVPKLHGIKPKFAPFALADCGLGKAKPLGQLNLRDVGIPPGFAQQPQQQFVVVGVDRRSGLGRWHAKECRCHCGLVQDGIVQPGLE